MRFRLIATVTIDVELGLLTRIKPGKIIQDKAVG